MNPLPAISQDAPARPRPPGRTVTLGGTSYPLVLPNIRDPRLHVAAVIITIHVLGQVGLHFRVSVPQILAAILTCAVLEIVLTFRQTRSFVWPASAMLTGSGVALILRVVGTPPDDPWNTSAWYVFAAFAGLSLLTKYVIKYRGSHVFNPSNIGLVVIFVVLGSSRVEPLDFWRVIVTSPEVLIFLFFMITDPKTVPAGRVGRVVFGLLVAVVSTLLMAPQTNEFGTKVGLLAGLVVMCAARPLLDRLLPEPKSAADDFRRFATRLAFGPNAGGGLIRGAVRVGLSIAAVLVLGVGIVLAGGPARGLVVPDTAEMLNGLPRNVDPATFPAITVGQDVTGFDHTIAGARAQQILLTLAENLELEDQALLRSDGTILTAVDHGDRLKEMQGRLHDAHATGRTVVDHYRFDSVHLVLLVPFGVQTGTSLGFESQGTVTEETYDASGALQDRRTAPFALTFAVRRATGGRWLNVAVLPYGSHG